MNRHMWLNMPNRLDLIGSIMALLTHISTLGGKGLLEWTDLSQIFCSFQVTDLSRSLLLYFSLARFMPSSVWINISCRNVTGLAMTVPKKSRNIFLLNL